MSTSANYRVKQYSPKKILEEIGLVCTSNSGLYREKTYEHYRQF